MPKKNKKINTSGDKSQKNLNKATKGFGKGQRNKFMKDPLYGKGSGSGMITPGKKNITSGFSERMKKNLRGLLNMKKGGSMNQYE